MNPKRLTRIQRIVIRSANWVGDAIMTTPAVATIRDRFPKARITVLAKPWVVPVFEHNPHVDEVMVYQANDRHRGPLGIWRLAGELRQRHFDLAILFQNAFEAALIAWLARIPRRLGFTTDGRSLLLTHRIRSWRGLKKGHLIDYYLGLLTGAGMVAKNRKLSLTIAPREQSGAQERLTALGIPANVPVIGLNPGAAYGTAKRWPAERYIRLGRRLIQTQHAFLLVFGGPGEARLGEEIAGRIGDGCLNLCNRTSLREAMALIQCCRVFVTNDSGLMHVAAALDVPQVVIIGPTDPVATGPANSASRIVHLPGSCELAPCLKPDCPLDHRCMTAIGMDSVLNAAIDMMQRRTVV
jgi:heptosyltransferase-2